MASYKDYTTFASLMNILNAKLAGYKNVTYEHEGGTHTIPTNIYDLAGYKNVTHERRGHKHNCAHTYPTLFWVTKM